MSVKHKHKELSKIIDILRKKNKKNLSVFLKNVKLFKYGAVFTSENPLAMETSPSDNRILYKDLKKTLTNEHFMYIPIRGFFEDNSEHSVAVWRIGLDKAKNLAGHYQQLSFIYVLSENNGVCAQYWELQNSNEPYNANSNVYELKKTISNFRTAKNDDEAFTILSNKMKIAFDTK